MEGRGIIAWTPENWLTVILMVWVGGAVFALATHLLFKARSSD